MTTIASRPLGQIETSMALMHQLNGSTQTTSLLSVGGTLPTEIINQAAAALHARHPLLHSRIEERADALHFCADVPFEHIAVQCLPSRTGTTQNQLLQQQLDQVLDPSCQLWRLLVLSDAQATQHLLLLTCHHAIVDAVSLVQLLDEFLDDCERLCSGLTLQCHVEPLAEPLEAHLADASAPAPVCATPPGLPYLQTLALEQRTTGVSRLLLQRSLSNHLQRMAVQQQLSLNSLLAGALLKSAEDIGCGPQLRIGTAVSLRQRAARTITRSSIGCYIGVAHQCLNVADRTLLDLATDYQQQLRASLPMQALRQPDIGLSARRQDIDRLRQQQGFSQGIALTNHGNILFSPRQHLQVHDYVNVASRVAGNFAVAVHVTRFQGCLSLCFTFAKPLMSETQIHSLQRKLLRALLSLNPVSEVTP